MQRKRLNIRLKRKLHSIPIINKVKSNVLYSIPCGCAFALLLVGITSLVSSNQCSAKVPIAGGDNDTSSISATASLSLSNPNMTSSAITPGSTATVSTNVTVSVDNAESYSLTLAVDNANLTNGSTTIVPGNVTNDNTWGYKWDNASTYTAPSTSGTTLTSSNNPTTGTELSNGSTSFTKNLTFGAKFSTSAEAGHYRGSGVLSLVAEPKKVVNPFGIETMQEMTLDICNAATIGDEATLIDTRDSSTYQIRKHEDGRCWMTQNLRLMGGSSLKEALSSTNSDGAPKTGWTMPASNQSGFRNNAASNAYLSGNTGYYTWCAATAGTCSSATSDGANASSSICPKGWKLPTGMVTGSNTSNDFYNLFKNMGLTISGSLSATSSTSWGSGDLAKVQASTYNFAYTGYMYYGLLDYTDSRGIWWSRTASNSAQAYVLCLDSDLVAPGTYIDVRYFGFAVRCVAEAPESKTFILTYDQNSTGSVTNMPSSQSCTTTSDSCTITLPNEKPQWSGYYLVGWDTTKKTTSCIVTAQYGAGSQITLTGDTTLYATWGISGCGSA